MEINWDEIAKNILRQEESIKPYISLEQINVLVTWRKNVYIGSIQLINEKFSSEIILLSKSSSPLYKELVDAIRKLDKGRIELCADDLLDLDGRQHILRRLENRLTFMTKEQTKYMVENPIMVSEIEINKI